MTVDWREKDLHAWQVLRPLLDRGGYLPWSTGSMRPAGLVAVCNEIVHGARTRIVECGSGVSTVVLARLMRERGTGRLIALEDDPHWAALMHEQLRREALAGIARVLHAPLQGEPPVVRTRATARAPRRNRPAARRRSARVRRRTRDAPRVRAAAAR